MGYDDQMLDYHGVDDALVGRKKPLLCRLGFHSWVWASRHRAHGEPMYTLAGCLRCPRTRRLDWPETS